VRKETQKDKKMKNIYALFLFLFCGIFALNAQQEAQNTQFFYFKQGYNPAYAGSREAFCMSAIYRQQWIGIEGAPQSQILTFSVPMFNQRVGVGANVRRTAVGINESITVDGVYSYRVRMGRGSLGIGLQGSLRSLRNNFQDSRLQSTQPLSADNGIPSASQQKLLFNVGAGLYYSTESFYFGVSAPRFLQNDIDFESADAIISREASHYYIMGGGTITLNDNLRLRPQALIKYVQNAPLDADLNLSLIIMDRYVFGGTYRLGGSTERGGGESIDILMGMQITPNVLFGISYDITLSELRDYNTGSVEATIQYCAGKSEGDEYINPRFF